MYRYLKYIPAGAFSAVVVCAILYLTLTPQPLPPTDEISFEWFDKVGHFFMFGGLCFAMTFDFRLAAVRRPGSCRAARNWQRQLWLALAAIILGGLIELLQMWMALGRTAEWADFAADVLGALVFSFLSPFLVSYIIRCRSGNEE